MDLLVLARALSERQGLSVEQVLLNLFDPDFLDEPPAAED